MERIISSTALDMFLSDIKGVVKELDFETLQKIIFINIDGFYGFVENQSLPGPESGKAFSELVEAVEPFIPLILNDDNVKLYLMTALNNDADELLRLEKRFISVSKARFLKNVISARSDEDWDSIFEVCRTIRDYKESGLMLNSSL